MAHWEIVKEEAETLRLLRKFFLVFLARLFSEHRNIVRYVDFLDRHKPDWAFNSMCFLIMERCAGGSLVDWVKKMKSTGRRTSKQEATLIAAQPGFKIREAV